MDTVQWECSDTYFTELIVLFISKRMTGITIFESPRETQFGSKKSGVPEIGDRNLTEANPRETTHGSKNREFEQLRVRTIEIPLYIDHALFCS